MATLKIRANPACLNGILLLYSCHFDKLSPYLSSFGFCKSHHCDQFESLICHVFLSSLTEAVQFYRAKDYAQRHSMGTLFHESKERLLLCSNPMFGAYNPGIWSSSTSSAFLATHAYSFPVPAPVLSELSIESGSGLGSHSRMVEKPAYLESSSADYLTKQQSMLGDRETVDFEDGGEKSLLHPIAKEEAIGEDSSDLVLSASSIRQKGTHEKERTDKLFRARWARILELASSILSSSAQQKNQAAAAKAGHTPKGAEVVDSIDGCQTTNGNGSLDPIGEGTGAVKNRLKKTNHSSSSSSLCTVVEVQALLDEACSMQPYTNAPGEHFAETMRFTLGELLMVRNVMHCT